VTAPEIFSARYLGQGENNKSCSRLSGHPILAIKEYDFDLGSGFAREIIQLNVHDQ
jgi:hypothetical protein